MARILIWRKIVAGSDIDIFGKTDYSHLCERNNELYGGKCPNWGNKLWFQGIYSEISGNENAVSFRTDETVSQINGNYDLIIYPMANFVGEEYSVYSAQIAKELEGVKIPVYVIACGIQAKNYGDIENLIRKIGDNSKQFIEAVYKTGGEFALRGYFTKEFFDRLGYKSAVVTGCPSMYQLGRNFRVTEEKSEIIQPIINGNLSNFEDIMRDIPEAVYFSQDIFADCLYNPSYFHNSGLKKDINFARTYSAYQAELLGKRRIKMIADMGDWYNYLINKKFNFSFGTRIHGTIMPLLADIPAVILPIDCRVREIAEFFNLPTLEYNPKKKYKADDLYSAYEQMSYTEFNKNYEKRFDLFENFLISRGIVQKVCENNRFLNKSLYETGFDNSPNTEKFLQYAEKLRKERLSLKLGKLAYKILKSGK